MRWLMVMVASLFEVGWVVGLKYATTLLQWTGTVICIALSFALLIKAGEKLPVSTVYAVFVGLGTIGTVCMDILFFGHPFDLFQLGFIFVLLCGVIGLKYVTDAEEKDNKEGEDWLGSV
jgi:paired small multidrug resistance pump